MTDKKKFPLHPSRPERVCWGCDRYCAADSMMCGNGSVRTQHPAELFGPDWYEWGPGAEEAQAEQAKADEAEAAKPAPVPITFLP